VDQLLEKLFTWWKDPHRAVEGLFADDFAYVGVSKIVDAEAWIHWVRKGKPSWDGVALLAMIAEERSGALLFEGTDPITALVHRISWFVEADRGRIKKLIEVSSVVETA